MSIEQLIQVQSIDVEVRQLRHRRETLAQRAELAEIESARAVEQERIDEVAAQRVEVASRQRRLEDEAQILASRAEADEARLYSGEVSGMKDLQALQDEIAGLKSRQGAVEDDAIEAMEESDRLAAAVTEMENSCSSLDEHIVKLRGEVADIEGEIDAKLSQLEERRPDVVAEIDAKSLAEYEEIRPRFGSATIVRFDGHKCVGCPSAMPSMEVDRLKHCESGTLEHCDECGRMIVV